MTGGTPDGLALDEGFADLLTDSFRRRLGRPLVEGYAGARPSASWLYREAPFCLLAHDGSADPRFVYANITAQARFGYGWDEFVGLPSRLSAEAPHREERQRVLEAVKRDGYVDGLDGMRVGKSGRRFRIEGAVVWDLIDLDGIRHGQAAAFWRWRDAGDPG